MANTTTLTIAGDASSVRQASNQATAALDDIQGAADDASNALEETGGNSGDLTARMGHLGSAVTGAQDAIGSLSDGLNALSDIQNMAANRAQRLARLESDVEQARIDGSQAAEDLRQANLDLTQSYLDGEQARIDGRQAAIDIKQAQLDATVATQDYNAAVKEFGANSVEARQAAIDLDQANADLEQATLDQSQAQQDANQYTADGRQAMLDATQATKDGKDSLLDLRDAQNELNPGALKTWAGYLEMATPLVTAFVGILGLVTAAQWLWNASLWASPVTWIVIAIAAVVAGIVILAMHTEELGKIWDVIWGGITDAATWAWDKITQGASMFWDHVQGVWKGLLALPGQLKNAFASVGSFITQPFRTAFNYVSDAWNNTVGRLSWSVPGWVPFIGGNSISAPRLPKWHTGGIVSGALGAEVMGVLKAGERVTAGPNGSTPESIHVTVEVVGDGVLRVVRAEVGRRGGDVQRALGGDRG